MNVTGKLTGVRLHTGDGSIVYRAQPGTAMAEDWEITTGDGGVSLYLPSDFSAELDAHTGDGRSATISASSPAGPGRSDAPHGERTHRQRRPAASHQDRRRIDSPARLGE